MIQKILILNLFLSLTLLSQTVTINLNQSDSDSLLKDLSGIISGPLPSHNSYAPDLTDGLRDIGIASIRNNDYGDDRLDMERMFNCLGSLSDSLASYPNWKGSPSDTNNYQWGASDTLFQSILDGGFEPFFRVGGEAGCHIEGIEHEYQGPRMEEEENFIEAVKVVVKHYLEFNGAIQNFEYLDLWTEYPNTKFWDRSARDFNEFWNKLYVALKSEFPQLKIGGPGFIVRFYENTETSSEIKKAISFLTHLYDNNTKPDWLGFHYIFNSVPLFQKNIDYFKKLLAGEAPFESVPWHNSNFFSDTELICDAYMVTKAYQDSLGNLVILTPTQIDAFYNRSKGASFLTAYWILLQRNRIEKAYYYRTGDSESDPSLVPSDPNQKTKRGLFWGNSAGDYKKTAYGFKLQNSLLMNDYKQILKFDEQLSIGESNSLWIIGAEKDSSNFAVLISNVSYQDKKINFTFNGEQITPDNYDISFKIVDKNSDGDIWKESRKSDLKISRLSVTLVEFTKKIPSDINEIGENYSYSLSQNYPNPFNPTTTIQFELNKQTNVTLKIYDILGCEITTLIKNEVKSAGTYEVTFDASVLASGTYVYKLTANNKAISKKMNLIK